MRSRLNGLIAAPHTPFDSNGDLKLSVIQKQCETLHADGVKGAFVCGTTGEGLSMTTEERMEVAQRWVDVAGSALKVIVHVGHNSQRDAMALARHARQIGAAAIGAMPPSFFKPATVDQLVEFMRPVASAAAGLPLYYYHIPSMTGTTISMVDFLQAGAERIPSLRGIKFTHGDLMEYQRCSRIADGEFDIAWGVDEMLLAALAVGADAAVGSTYNYAAPLYLKMIAAFQRGDLDTARQCAGKSVDMIAVLLKHGVLRTGKATMGLIGIDLGPTRSPVPPLVGEELNTVRRTYERLGFFDWAVRGDVRTTVSAVVPTAQKI
jgi:N-acetylneuraminate lyase